MYTSLLQDSLIKKSYQLVIVLTCTLANPHKKNSNRPLPLREVMKVHYFGSIRTIKWSFGICSPMWTFTSETTPETGATIRFSIFIA